jgi:hypothetical protein
MLPFTADILFASFGQYNRPLWPAQILVWLLGLAALLATFRPMRGGDRAVATLLSAAWLWTGVAYHMLHFATINFMAPLYGAVFVLEGLLLAWAGVARGKLAFRFHADVAGWAGLAFAVAALALWPLADLLTGQGWPGVRLPGLAPAPTALFTLGLLLLTQGRTPIHLLVIPVVWALVAGATAWILAIPQDLALPAAGLGGLALALWRNRRAER